MANRMILNETSYIGAGAIENIVTEAKVRDYKKALVVTDKDLIKFNVATKITDLLKANNLAFEIFDEVKANPTINVVLASIEKFKSSGADYLLAIGGGSSIDTAFYNYVGTSVNAGVLLYSFDDEFSSILRQNLEEVQNENKINFTFFDGKGNQATQNAIIDSLVQDDFNFLVLNLVQKDEGLVEDIIYKAKQKNIPVIFIDMAIDKPEVIKDYNKAVIITPDIEQSGTIEGKILVDLWNSNKEAIDKNKDNILQYVMLQGKRNLQGAITRTKSAISVINNAGIKTEQLELVNANWGRASAQQAIESLFLKYDSKIEAIISNNDAMAIGDIEGLQKYGYNIGDKTKSIPVVGIDAIPEAQVLIKKGLMAGSVALYPRDLAEAIYTVGMNLVLGQDPIEGTNYKFDKTSATISLPVKEYTFKSVS